jgi:hypothetical protein
MISSKLLNYYVYVLVEAENIASQITGLDRSRPVFHRSIKFLK